MPFPKTLNLFGEKWKVLKFKTTGALNHEHRGMTVFPLKEIHILAGSMEQSTVLHEIIHVAEEMTGANLTEAQVVALERGLWNIFSTNPKLLEYFNERQTVTTADNSTIIQTLLEYGTSTSDATGNAGSRGPVSTGSGEVRQASETE
jgi:hypothetical protein